MYFRYTAIKVMLVKVARDTLCTKRYKHSSRNGHSIIVLEVWWGFLGKYD